MSATPRIISDPHNILADMRENGSYVTGDHIVYKANTHGEEYLDKDAHLQHPEAAEKVIQLLAQQISPDSIIIGPETRASVVLGERIAAMTQSRFIPTKKVSDVHTFPEETRSVLLQGKHPRILVDDILNNGETFVQVSKAMKELGLTIDEFHVMVDRNPEKSGQL
jgi:orotate phosphoribosyltransferase